jgi:hypothetical protein
MARIRVPYGRHALTVLIGALAVAYTGAQFQSAATVGLAPTAVLKVDRSRPGQAFALGAVGLSTEARELSTGHLSAGRNGLVRLMRLLGPSVLRIGGNSVDFSWWTSSGEPPPAWATSTVTPADLSALHRLLAATRWKVLLGVDLGHFEPARVADEARYAQKILGVGLLGIEIGNEPDAYGGKKDSLRTPTYSAGEYLREAEAYHRALSTTTHVYGPALSLKPPWLGLMGTAARMFTQLTQHYYPINTCPTTQPLSPQPTAVELLSPAIRQQEDAILHTLALAGSIAGRPTRIGETNSVACGGNMDASPGFAGALWSLDWILRAESSGVQGLNFHSSLGPCRSYRESPICASGNEEAANPGNVTAQPEYYGLLAARQLEGGRFVPTRLIAPNPLPNLTTWATITPRGTVKIAIDNLATTGLAQPVSISIPGYAATEETLVASSTEASSNVALGATPVANNGKWRPKLRLLGTRRARSIRVIVPPASAIVLTLYRRR